MYNRFKLCNSLKKSDCIKLLQKTNLTIEELINATQLTETHFLRLINSLTKSDLQNIIHHTPKISIKSIAETITNTELQQDEISVIKLAHDEEISTEKSQNAEISTEKSQNAEIYTEKSPNAEIFTEKSPNAEISTELIIKKLPNAEISTEKLPNEEILPQFRIKKPQKTELNNENVCLIKLDILPKNEEMKLITRIPYNTDTNLTIKDLGTDEHAFRCFDIDKLARFYKQSGLTNEQIIKQLKINAKIIITGMKHHKTYGDNFKYRTENDYKTIYDLMFMSSLEEKEN